MREIKFRAWHKSTGEMYGIEHLQFDGGGDLSGLVADKGLEWRNVIPITHFELMQFTGLFDSLKVGVYEGDIVKIEGCSVGIIEYLGASFVIRGKDFKLALNDQAPEYVEIIGNIYENPELVSKDGYRED
jgi:YopX protein